MCHSILLICLLLIQSVVTQSLNETNSSKLIDTIRANQSSQNVKRNVGATDLFRVARKDLLDGLEKIQSSMSDRNLECMPNSVFYNGTCIYISSRKEKLSWVHAERFCRRLPLNTTFAVIQNDHKYEFVRKEIAKIREKENPTDQLVFYLGFRYQKSEWRWVNNVSISKTNLTLGKYWWDWSGSHGDCGSVALLKNNELIMRSAPCMSTSGRFICEYNLNPCYMNDVCGKRGRCVNLYYKFYCDCSMSIFFEGKYCDKCIQVIIGLTIIIVMTLGILCNSELFKNIWNFYCGKSVRPTTSDRSYNDYDKLGPGLVDDTPRVEYQSVQRSVNYTSLSLRFKHMRKRILSSINQKNLTYGILIISTLMLAFVQILFIHNYLEIEFVQNTKKSKFVQDTCTFMEEYYLFEDLIYLPFSLLFLLVLYVFLQSRRFNNYIMIKFHHYFKSPFFKKIQSELRERQKQRVKEKEQKLKQQACGKCRYFSYKCCSQAFCSCFCCLFCCSCCVPPGSNTKCFIWYCCCLGWRQTDFYKVLKTVWTIIKLFFYYTLCCPVWKCLWKLTKQAHDKKANKTATKPKRKPSVKKPKKVTTIKGVTVVDDADEDSTDIDQDDEFDETDFNLETQNLSRNPCPFPSTPFSTSNRALSAAVYIIYTYDVLNIFMFVFMGNYLTTTTYLPFVGNLSKASGVLVELIMQFLQVILIGIKFYPILIVADAQPNIIIYFFSTIYMLFIWLSWFMKKAFCSRTEAFIKRAFRQISTELGNRIRTSFNIRRNVTDGLLAFATDEDRQSEIYLNALKDKVPGVFKEFFGRYDGARDSSSLGLNEDLIDESALIASYSTPSDNYYGLSGYLASSTMTTSTTTTTTTTMMSTSSYGFRSMLKNKTLSNLKSFGDVYRQREEIFSELVSIMENLPLYLTLSYLLMRYGLLFFDGVASLFTKRNKCCSGSIKKKNNELAVVNETGEMNHDDTVTREMLEKMLNELDDSYREKNLITNEIVSKRNSNYSYIKNMLDGLCLFDPRSRTEREIDEAKRRGLTSGIRRIQKSYVWNLLETRIYKVVPYMRYSKQFINTYTVAFMVVYFFTLFGFRLSNLFGNAFEGTVELLFRLVLKNIVPTFNIQEHNFNTEFRVACLLTSLIISVQLFQSIKTFHDDLIKLHKGEKFFRSLIVKYKEEDYSSFIKTRNKASSTITSDSLHFPGYLVAHLVYGYVVIFLVIFTILLFSKIFYYLPGLSSSLLQILLPVFILFAFKFVSIKFLITSVFLRDDSQRITNLAPYYVISYFSFFFDCFLGLVACMSRVWQTTIISLIRLPRLDKSMFNKEDDLLMRRLDKGHVSYLNYVRMEHWYNNPVLNGFCEMLIESMLYSQIYRAKFEIIAKSSLLARKDSVAMIEENDFDDKKKKRRQMKVQMKRYISKTSHGSEYHVREYFMPNRPKSLTLKTQTSKTSTVSSKDMIRALHSNTPSDPIVEEDEELTSPVVNDDLIRTMGEENDYININEDDEVSLGVRSQATDASAGARSQVTIKKGNDQFKYESFLRLRNIFYLCLLLKKNPTLQTYRYHYLQEVKRRDLASNRSKVESSSNFISMQYERLKIKLNLKPRYTKNSMSGDVTASAEPIGSSNARMSRKDTSESLLSSQTKRTRNTSL